MLVGVVDVEVLNTLLKLLMVTVVLVVEVEGEMVIVPSIKQVLQTLAVAVERRSRSPAFPGMAPSSRTTRSLSSDVPNSCELLPARSSRRRVGT